MKHKDQIILIKLGLLTLLVIGAVILFFTVNVNPNYRNAVMNIRVPKVAAMLLAAFCIGGATMIFQTIIGNVIFTPCLLGINALYTLIHTAMVFFLGSTHILVRHANLAFGLDLIVMGVTATFVYGYLFKKTNNNILYILLIGTVLSSLFASTQNTLVRIMDPNEYEALLSKLVASFHSVNSSIIIIAILLILTVLVMLRKELRLLDVLVLGKDQAINLGVDYDNTIRKLLMGVILLISIATALVGPVSFLGLILANLARQILKTYQHKYLITASVLIGMFSLVSAQLVVEQVFSYSIPISVFITTGGGIYFLYLILRKERFIA